MAQRLSTPRLPIDVRSKSRSRMVGGAGIEPATYAMSTRCSTAELTARRGTGAVHEGPRKPQPTVHPYSTAAPDWGAGLVRWAASEHLWAKPSYRLVRYEASTDGGAFVGN